MIYKIKNNKGMLLASETLKIVLSVISIGFLIFLLVSIYYVTSPNKELEDAHSTMEKIVNGFVLLNSENPSLSLEGIGPGGWKIFSYSLGDEKPNICGGYDCICICDTPTINLGNSQLKKCTKEGACEKFEPLIKNEDILIKKDGSTGIIIYKQDGWYGIKQK